MALRDRRLRCLSSHKGSARNSGKIWKDMDILFASNLVGKHPFHLFTKHFLSRSEKNTNIESVLEPVGLLRAMADSAIVAAVLALTLV